MISQKLVLLILIVVPPWAMGNSIQIECAKTTAQLARPIFFVQPVPFSDDLMPEALGKKVTFDWNVSEKRRLTPKEIYEAYAKPLRDAPGPLGVQLKDLLKGRRFVDLGCGPPDIAAVPRIVAEALGAKEYVGVDIKNPEHSRCDEFGNGGKFTSTFVKRDMSAFLADEKKVGKSVFYLSGIEARKGNETAAAQYAVTVKENLKRLTAPGDAVIIGSGTSHFDIIPGFQRVPGNGDQRIFIRH